MKPDYYTFTGQHPDDAINKVKVFINELQKVQEHYFKELLNDLGITEELDDWLFDYIYNEDPAIDLMFTEYMEDKGKKYEDFVKND
jgi:hypothetical protein